MTHLERSSINDDFGATMAMQINNSHRLEDRAQIQWACDDYGFGMDLRRPEQWLRAFHDDAVYDVDYPRRTCRGSDDLLDWVQGVWDNFEITNHFTPNEQVSFVDDTHATGEGRGGVMFVMADGSYITGAAIFEDRFEKRDGTWKISYRRVDVNHLAQHPSAVMTKNLASIAAAVS